jgi:hypothetical protein
VPTRGKCRLKFLFAVDGRDIHPGAIVAGRRVLGGADEGIPPDEVSDLQRRLGIETHHDVKDLGKAAGRYKGSGPDSRPGGEIFIEEDTAPQASQSKGPHSIDGALP